MKSTILRLSITILTLVLFVRCSPVASNISQINPTEQEQTLDAEVNRRITATAESQLQQNATAVADETAMYALTATSQASMEAIAAETGFYPLNRSNVNRMTEVTTLGGNTHYLDLAFNCDNSVLALVPTPIYSPRLELWNIMPGIELTSLGGHRDSVLAVAFNPNCSLLASGSRDRTVRIWDLAREESQIFQGHTDWVKSVSFSPDGMRLASGSTDTTVRIWDITSGNQYATLLGHTQGVNSVSFSPDGRLLASGGDDGIRLWDIESGIERTNSQRTMGNIQSVIFSQNGTLLAASGANGNLRLWDIAAGNELVLQQGPISFAADIAISPDSAILAVGYTQPESAVRFWEVASGRQIGILQLPNCAVSAVAFNLNGTLLAVSCQYVGSVTLWGVPANSARSSSSDIPQNITRAIGEALSIPEVLSDTIDAADTIYGIKYDNNNPTPFNLLCSSMNIFQTVFPGERPVVQSADFACVWWDAGASLVTAGNPIMIVPILLQPEQYIDPWLDRIHAMIDSRIITRTVICNLLSSDEYICE
jgi:WD40 repeat protein